MSRTIQACARRRAFGCALTALLLLLAAPPAEAHIGSPSVFFEGQAGPYPVRVVVRPPGVIPGLAEISVRVNTNGITHVTALPMRWNTGRKGAPPPDEAMLVRGETNLYSAQLWFMVGGAQSVEVRVSGQAGSGSVVLPVNATATRVLGLPRALGWILGGLGVVLVLLLSTIFGAALRESSLPAAALPSRKRLWMARATTLSTALFLAGMAWLGKRWWDSEAANYRNNRLFHPLEVQASVLSSEGRPRLRLELQDERFERGAPPVPDHGKLMHLFLVREPGLDCFAHLHPERLDWKRFETALPNLPGGQYRLYGDVTDETGFSQTLTTEVTLPGPSQNNPAPPSSDSFDPDDAWCQTAPVSDSLSTPPRREETLQTAGGPVTVDWLAPDVFRMNEVADLRFQIRDGAGHSVPVEPYLGMAGHLVLRRNDGAVFTHLHPGGSFSMAALQLFQLRDEGKAPLKVASAKKDPLCALPTSQELEAAAWGRLPNSVITFPYAFPKPGPYRVWFQCKVRGEILTSAFDVRVEM